jgi:hypothetical protein
MRIQIETVPHAQQRYETTGDWWWDPDDTLQMRVSALAELAPRRTDRCSRARGGAALQGSRCVYGSGRRVRHGSGERIGWPGDDPRAPYHREHEFAGCVERLLAHELGIDWNDYEDALDALYE